ICVELHVMSQALAIADIRAVIVRAPDRLFVAYAYQLWLGRSGEGWVKRPAAARTATRHLLIDIDGLVLVQAENMGIFRFQHGILSQRPAITEVEFFGYRIAVIGIDQASHASIRELRRGSSDGWHWADSVLPLCQCQSRSRNYIRRSAEAEHLLEHRLVRHLLHEEWNVLEDVSVVQAEPAAQHVLAGTRQIISKAESWTEIFVVIVRKFADVRIGERIVESHEFLVRAAVFHIRTTDEIEILVPTHTQVQRQTRVDLPVVLEIQAKLLSGYLESRIPVGNSHSGNGAWTRKALWIVHRIAQNGTGIVGKVDFQSGTELKISTLDGIPDVIASGFQCVIANGLSDVVFELPLTLERLLRNIGVGSERRVGKNYQRFADVA